jgi:hypothetical protein
MEILKIHASKLAKSGDIDYEAVVKLAEGFNGADLRNICTGGWGVGDSAWRGGGSGEEGWGRAVAGEWGWGRGGACSTAVAWAASRGFPRG